VDALCDGHHRGRFILEDPRVPFFPNFHETSRTKASKPCLFSESSNSLFCSHQAATSSSSRVSISWCRPTGTRTLNQTSLVTTHPANRCETVSDAWLQRAQPSSSCRPWRLRRSLVQSLLCKPNQKKNFTLGGALTRQSSLAPYSSVEPTKKAR
jgi:hypothetical protein